MRRWKTLVGLTFTLEAEASPMTGVVGPGPTTFQNALTPIFLMQVGPFVRVDVRLFVWRSLLESIAIVNPMRAARQCVLM